MHDQDPIDPRQINDLYCYVTSHQANSAWPSLRGYAQSVLAMVAAAAMEENGELGTLKTREWKTGDQIAWVEIAGLENAGPNFHG